MITQEEINKIIETRNAKSEASIKLIQEEFDLVQETWSNKFSEEIDPIKAKLTQKEWNIAIEVAQKKKDNSIEIQAQKEQEELEQEELDNRLAFEKWEKEDEKRFLKKLKNRKK